MTCLRWPRNQGKSKSSRACRQKQNYSTRPGHEARAKAASPKVSLSRDWLSQTMPSLPSSPWFGSDRKRCCKRLRSPRRRSCVQIVLFFSVLSFKLARPIADLKIIRVPSSTDHLFCRLESSTCAVLQAPPFERYRRVGDQPQANSLPALHP